MRSPAHSQDMRRAGPAPRRVARALGALLLGLFAITRSAHAQSPRPDFPLTDGVVYASAVAGNTLYIGGNFAWVGPATGGFVAVDASTGARTANWPRTDGAVYASAPDGSGGWYIGGAFQHVAGIARTRLAHVLANGSLAPWNPGADGEVHALALGAGVVYAGGYFATAGALARSGIAALDATTGGATAWNPGATGPTPYVLALLVNGGTVIAGGAFTGIGGQARGRLAALDVVTGSASAWNPGADATVRTLALAGSTLYAGGDFTSIGGQSRGYLAALDTGTGLATGWNPGASYTVLALAVSGSTVYAGGAFNTIGGQARARLAALSATTGLATAWNPGVSGSVNVILPSGGSIYVGGSFATIGGRSRNCLALVDGSSGMALNWTANTNDEVTTLAINGSTVVVGGIFGSLGGLACSNAAAIDLRNAEVVTTWNPGANFDVLALAVKGAVVYLGGRFTTLGGIARNHLAAVEGEDALLLPWNPDASNEVDALLARDNVIYAGGAFSSVGAVVRNNLAAIDANSGSTLAWNPSATGGAQPCVFALAANGPTIVAGGRFGAIGGTARSGIAAIDSTTGATTAWNPSAGGTAPYVYALALSGATLYAGGDFTSIGGQSRARLAALGVTSGLATSWNPGADNAVTALALLGGRVYAGGAFANAGGQSRAYLAAIDSASGVAAAWNAPTDAAVSELSAVGGTIIAGGSFATVSGLPHAGIAAIDTALTGAFAVAVLSPNGGETVALGSTVGVRWSAAGGSGLQSADLYLSRTGPSGPWETIAAGVTTAKVFAWPVSGAAVAGNAYLRVDARDWFGNVLTDVSNGGFTLAAAPAAVPQGDPLALALAPPAPNPSMGRTLLAFVLPTRAHVRLSVLDVQGREVAVFADGLREAGRQAVMLDATTLRPGLYFARLQAGGAVLSQRCVVIR